MKKEGCNIGGHVNADQILVTVQNHLTQNEPDAAEKILLELLHEKETPAAWRGMASVHCLRRDMLKAVEAAEKAVELDENDHLSLGMLGFALNLKGDFVNAFGLYALAIRAGRNVLTYKQNFIDVSEKIVFSEFNPQVRQIVLDCLEIPELECSRLHRLWHCMLQKDSDFSQVYGTIEEAGKKKFDCKSFDELKKIKVLTNPLFLLGLQKIIVYETVFEEFLTYLRAFLLEQLCATEQKLSRLNYIKIASSLAQYCFFTEYIFDCPEDEQKKIDAIHLKLDASVDGIDDTAALAIYACYAPLCGLKLSREIGEKYKVHADMGNIVKSQILEQDELQAMRTSIPVLTAIDDSVSCEVQKQYEEFPYPRWREFGEEIDMEVEARFIGKPIDILITGCGTGREAVQLSTNFPSARILAVDLSLTSLSYAVLRAKENNCSNIDFAQADILRLGDLGRKFDYIHSCGVLHHLKDPVIGWKVLCELLAKDGLMRVALYSKTARRSIIEARSLIQEKNIASTVDGIRFFRKNLRSLMKEKDADNIILKWDYYTIPMIRDLLFHVQERQFTLPEIENILNELNLEFIKFDQSNEAFKKYREKFPDDPSATSFANWHIYEEEYPETFKNMYTFWCRRKK